MTKPSTSIQADLGDCICRNYDGSGIDQHGNYSCPIHTKNNDLAIQADNLREQIRTIWRPLYDMGYKGHEQIDAHGMAYLISSATDETEQLLQSQLDLYRQELKKSIPEKRGTGKFLDKDEYLLNCGYNQAINEVVTAFAECEFCGDFPAKNIYYQKRACNKCMVAKNPAKPTKIKRFPDQAIDEYLRKHGKLPE